MHLVRQVDDVTFNASYRNTTPRRTERENTPLRIMDCRLVGASPQRQLERGFTFTEGCDPRT